MERFRTDLGDLTDLAESIKELGLIHPIVVDSDGVLIAGERRLKACELAGVEPEYRIVDFENPIKAELHENTMRKDFLPSEIVAISKYLNNTESRQGERVDTQNTNFGANYTEVKQPRDKVAEMVGKSAKTVSKIKQVFESDNEELKEQLDKGIISVDSAYKEVKRDKVRKAHNESIKKIELDLKERPIDVIVKTFDVIVIDPPWPMKKIERNVAPNQFAELDYPTMTIEEIKNFKLPHKEHTHIFMWTTQKFLPNSFEIFDYWNVKYVLTMGWHKNGGFQPFNLPQYNEEFILYGRIGTPKFKDTKAFNTCNSWNRGKHSEKPNEFYELINRVTLGDKVDIFNRREIVGFKTWGNES